jgi:hypothetical protein
MFSYIGLSECVIELNLEGEKKDLSGKKRISGHNGHNFRSTRRFETSVPK